MQRGSAMTRVPYDSELQPMAEWFMATYGPTMPAHVAPDGAAALRTAAPCARAGRASSPVTASPRAPFEVPGDETGPASEITIFSPESVAAGRGVFYIHGGGMVMGHRFDDAEFHIGWAEELQVPVITVGYRLAPENPFPAATDDVRRAWLWVVEHATELGIDPSGLILTGAQRRRSVGGWTRPVSTGREVQTASGRWPDCAHARRSE